MTTPTATTQPAPLFKSYNGLTRHNIAALFTRAAIVLRNGGYSPYPDYEGETGHDIEGALKDAAEAFISTHYRRVPRSGEVDDITDELITRLGAVLFLAGVAEYDNLRNEVYNFQTSAYEGGCTAWAKYRTIDDIIAALNLAGQLVCLLPESRDEWNPEV